MSRRLGGFIVASVLGLAVCFMIFQVVAAGVDRVASKQIAELTAESKAFVDQAVIDITTNWDGQEFVKRAAPQMRKNLTPEKVAYLFDNLARIGRLAHYDGAQGAVNVTKTIGKGTETKAHYDASAAYERAPGYLAFDLAKTDGQWVITNFEFKIRLDPPSASSSGSPWSQPTKASARSP